jgi:hypothetical protein
MARNLRGRNQFTALYAEIVWTIRRSGPRLPVNAPALK